MERTHEGEWLKKSFKLSREISAMNIADHFNKNPSTVYRWLDNPIIPKEYRAELIKFLIERIPNASENDIFNSSFFDDYENDEAKVIQEKLEDIEETLSKMYERQLQMQAAIIKLMELLKKPV